MNILKSIWSRFWLRGVQYSGRYDAIKKLYLVEDPWNLRSSVERARFQESNGLVKKIVPDCQRLLELGCGEGIQSKWLADCCTDLTGIDVSDIAIVRAKRAVPGAKFHAGQIENVAEMLVGQRFDLAVAFEVLYYVQDCEAVLRRVMSLTDTLLVTNFESRFDHILEHFAGPEWTQMEDIVVEGKRWKVSLWRKPAAV